MGILTNRDIKVTTGLTGTYHVRSWDNPADRVARTGIGLPGFDDNLKY